MRMRRRTVRVNVAGGLGNQMFMYAAGRAVAVRTGSQLVLNASGFSRDYTYKRIFLLDHLPIPARVLPDSWPTRLLGPMDRLVMRCPWLVPELMVLQEGYRDGYSEFNDTLLKPPPNRALVLRGFWQDERYFQDFSDLIRCELAPPAPRDPVAIEELSRIERSRHPVAIAIRFYREVPGESSDPQRIIDAFRRVLVAHAASHTGCSYFLFTEEPQYFKKADVLGVDFIAIKHRPRNEDALVDLYLMSRCQTFFVGYSSFHWWGAWLSATNGKQVTYLRFPGRPGREYAASGWTTLEV
jgi:hypothetical protein